MNEVEDMVKIQRGHQWLECSTCRTWIHAYCGKVSEVQYEMFRKHAYMPWYCKNCVNNMATDEDDVNSDDENDD